MNSNEVRAVIDSKWIERAVEVVNKLWTDFEEDCHNLNYRWEGMSLKEIMAHLASLTPEEYEKEVGYAKGNFHCLVHIYGGPFTTNWCRSIFFRILLQYIRMVKEKTIPVEGGLKILQKMISVSYKITDMK